MNFELINTSYLTAHLFAFGVLVYMYTNIYRENWASGFPGGGWRREHGAAKAEGPIVWQLCGGHAWETGDREG